MRKLHSFAIIAVLLGIPGSSYAETSPQDAAPATSAAQDRRAADGDGSADDASNYAAREKAAPQLKEFSGGRDGVYLTTTALVIILLVVLVLVLI
jgi:hypothetical protein